MTDQLISFARLRADIIAATVTAVNATLYIGEERALKDVPVRKIFRGGKQTVRFKTAGEIESDKDLRSRLGLAPEILATPEAIERVRAAGKNPKKGTHFGAKEFGFARTIAHPSTDPRRLTRGVDRSSYPGSDIIDRADLTRYLQREGPGLTRAQRGLVQVRRNKANDFLPFGEDIRPVKRSETGNSLVDENAERYLTTKGRYELRSGRAFHQRTKKIATVEIKGGKVTVTGTTDVPVGPERLGGGLRGTIRIIPATASMYPVIEGWLVAGDEEHDYAKYQELGTRHNPAHPFLRPRLPEWKEELPEQLRRSYGRTGR